MDSVTLPITKHYDTDVAVAGGGVAGLAAAVASARSGARTVLAESASALGGTATSGLVGPFMTSFDSKGKNQIIRGFFDELIRRLEKEGGAIPPENCLGVGAYNSYKELGHFGVTPFNPDTLKRVAEEMCVEAGVRILYHTSVIGAKRDGDRISSIICSSCDDIAEISAKVFIDATGTATLAARGGAEVFRGDEEGNVQPASMFFMIRGVDRDALDEHASKYSELDGHWRERRFADILEEGRKSGELRCAIKKLRIFEGMNGDWWVNMAEITDVNELDAAAYSDAVISQREQVENIFRYIKKNVPPLRNIELAAVAQELGIRESRRIVGRKMLTLGDINDGVEFEDKIAFCSNSVDVHTVGLSDYRPNTEKNYYIPLGALISKNTDNLLAAGKTVSADRYAFGAIRVMPPAMAMGEAAGITAALSAIKGISVPQVDYKDVQKELIARGACLK